MEKLARHWQVRSKMVENFVIGRPYFALRKWSARSISSGPCIEGNEEGCEQ